MKRTQILLPLLGFLIGILLLEAFLQSYYWASNNDLVGLTPRKTTIGWLDDPVLGRRLVPSQEGWFVANTSEYKTWITTNSKGWRDTEHIEEKPGGTYRILVLGDSFVENFQVPLEDTFFKQLEGGLGKTVEVVAMGMGNTGSAQQLIALKELGIKYQPDLVVQLFYTGNDIRNNYEPLNKNPFVPYVEFSQGELAYISPNPPIASETKELLKRWAIVEKLLELRQRFLEKEAMDSTGYPEDYQVYKAEYTEDYQKAWELTKQIIVETKETANKVTANYILVSLANNEQVNTSLWQKLFDTYPKMASANLDLEKPDKLLGEFCEDEKIECYFMLPYFKEFVGNNAGATTHYLLDGHWNETGTNLAADFLEDKLKEIISSSQEDSSQ